MRVLINVRFNFFAKFQFESVATIIFQPVENSHPLWWHAPRHARPSLLYCRQRPNSPTPRLFARPSQCCLTLLWSPATAFYPCRCSRAHTLTLFLSLSLYCILPLFFHSSLSPFLSHCFLSFSSFSLLSVVFSFFSFSSLSPPIYLSIHPSICLTLDLHQPTYRLWETLPTSLFLSFSESLSLLTFLSISLPRRRALCESLVNLLAPL